MPTIILVFLLTLNSLAICDYPHNPPAVCFSGSVVSKEQIKHPIYKCLVSAKVSSLLRPAKTYSYTKDLDKIVHKSESKIKRDRVQFYSSNNCDLSKITTILEYNCSDKNSGLKDLVLLDREKLRLSILDQWTEKEVTIDCTSLLSK